MEGIINDNFSLATIEINGEALAVCIYICSVELSSGCILMRREDIKNVKPQLL